MGNHQAIFSLTHTNQFKQNSVIIITGASSGLGKQLALAYSKRKVKLVLTGRNQKRLNEVKQECQQNEAEVLCFIGDLNQETQCKKLIEFTYSNFNKIDILILNAGINAHFQFANNQNLSVFNELMKTNYHANIFLTKYALTYLKRSKGQIVLISSFSGKFGLPSRTAYCASKFAITGFFLSLMTQDVGVDITIIYPPSLDTPMRDHDILNKNHEKKLKNDNQTRYDPKQTALLILKAVDYRVQQLFFPTKIYLVAYIYPFFKNTLRQKMKKASKL